MFGVHNGVQIMWFKYPCKNSTVKYFSYLPSKADNQLSKKQIVGAGIRVFILNKCSLFAFF